MQKHLVIDTHPAVSHYVIHH